MDTDTAKRAQDRLLAVVIGEGRENCDGAIDEGDDDFLLHAENGIIGETKGSSEAGPEPTRRLPAIATSEPYRRPKRTQMMITMISQGLGVGLGHTIITQQG